MTDKSKDDQASPKSDQGGHAQEVQVTADMIASNVDSADRVAPSLGKITIIDGLYDFADRNAGRFDSTSQSQRMSNAHSLLDRAHEAARNAYVPYSKFRVGAAVLAGGSIHGL